MHLHLSECVADRVKQEAVCFCLGVIIVKCTLSQGITLDSCRDGLAENAFLFSLYFADVYFAFTQVAAAQADIAQTVGAVLLKLGGQPHAFECK